MGKVTLCSVSCPLCTISTRFARIVLERDKKGSKKHLVGSGGKQNLEIVLSSFVGNVIVAYERECDPRRICRVSDMVYS